MKWKIMLIALFAIALLLTPMVLAEDDTELEDPGILPGHPFYGFKKLGERLKLMFTFNSKAKIKYKLKLSGRRLAEAELMNEANKTQVVQQLMEQYQAQIGDAEQIRERLRLRNITADDVDEWMNRTTNKHIYVLQRVLEKAPESAKPGLQNALQNAEQHREQVRERIIEKIERWRNRTTTTTVPTTTTTTEETTTTSTTTTTQPSGPGGQEGVGIGTDVEVNHTSAEDNETETD